jgi:hypothetical protein
MAIISAEDCFAIWAPDDSFWSQWAKPVVFASALLLKDDDVPALPVMDAPALPRTFDPVAVVVDLPGALAVTVGLALARRGFRPVPLFNGTSGPSPVVAVEPIERALGGGTSILRTCAIASDARPVFLLDCDRGNPMGGGEPGRYDNRWIVLPQDVPSATTLAARGIREVVLIRQRLDLPDQDLAYVLLRWREGGLRLRQVALETGEANDALALEVPASMRRLWYAAIALIGLRRSSVGGFGAIVPQQTQGSGFYG